MLHVFVVNRPSNRAQPMTPLGYTAGMAVMKSTTMTGIFAGELKGNPDWFLPSFNLTSLRRVCMIPHYAKERFMPTDTVRSEDHRCARSSN